MTEPVDPPPDAARPAEFLDDDEIAGVVSRGVEAELATEPVDIPGWDADVAQLPADEAEDAKESQQRYEDKQKRKLDALEYLDQASEVDNRHIYTGRIFWLTSGWMVAVFAVAIASGVNLPPTAPSQLHWWPWPLLGLGLLAAGLLLESRCPRTQPASKKKDEPEGRATSSAGGEAESEGEEPALPGWLIRVVSCSLLTMSALVLVVGVCGLFGLLACYPRLAVTGWPLGHWIAAFELSDTLLIALVGGATANVIGLFIIVAKYLFPVKRKR